MIKLISYILSPLVIMIAFFQLGSDYKLPGVMIFIGYICYLISLAYLEKTRWFILGIVGGLLAIGVAYNLQNDFWTKRNFEVCEKLKSDPLCEYTEFGFQCGPDSSFGEFKVAKKMCSI